MVLSNVIDDITISCCSFVFGQSHAKISAGFTNVSSLAVAAFHLAYCSLSVHPDDHTRPHYEMTPGFKPVTINSLMEFWGAMLDLA